MASSSNSSPFCSAGAPPPPTVDPTRQRVLDVLAKPSSMKVAQKRQLIDQLCGMSNLSVVFYPDTVLARARSLLSFQNQTPAQRTRIMDGKFCASLLYDLAALLELAAEEKKKLRASARTDPGIVRSPEVVRSILKLVRESKTRALAEAQSERIAGEKKNKK